VTVEYPALSGLVKLDFSKGKLAFLSDLDPIIVTPKEMPPREWIDRYGRDRDLDRQPIRLREKAYEKGLTLHAPQELVYDIGGDYKEFRAVLGVVDGVRESQVQLTVEGDGKVLFQAVVRREDEPRPVALDVRGVRKLRLRLEAHDRLFFGQQMSLADAKVSK
jgi:hypothetical protein